MITVTVFTQKQLVDLITNVMGVRPVSMQRMAYGEMNIVYEVLLPNQAVILRVNEIAIPLEGTESNISITSDLGLPVPKVLHSDVSKSIYPFAYIILEKIPGQDLRFELPQMTRHQISNLAKTIVSFQRKVRTLPLGQGFGFAAINKKASSKSWTDIVDWNLQCGIPYIQDVVGEDGIGRLKQQACRYRTYFEEIQPECFLDDITIKNVIMLNGELQGIIDLDWVCYGDPLNMLGLTQTSIIADVGYDALVYFDELCHYWDLSYPQRGIVDFYSLVHATNLVRLRRMQNENEPVNRLEESVIRWVSSF